MFDLRKKIAARLKSCRAAKGWTLKEMAAHLSAVTGESVGASVCGSWEQALNRPTLEKLIALSQLYGKPAGWIGGLSDDDGTAPETGGYIVPPVSTVQTTGGIVELGDNGLAWHHELLQQLKLSKTKMLAAVAPDNSMTGKIEEGDRVLIDLSTNTVTRDDLFALIVSDRLWLRWIRQDLEGNYVIQAEAREVYPDQHIAKEKLAELHVLGRVSAITHTR